MLLNKVYPMEIIQRQQQPKQQKKVKINEIFFFDSIFDEF